MASNIIDQYVIKCEQEVLISILDNPNVIDVCMAVLSHTDFADARNRILYKVIYDLYISTKQINKSVIIDFITNNPSYQFPSWQDYVEELSIGFSYGEDLKTNLEIIKNASIKRQLDIFANKIIATKIDFAKYDNQIFDLTTEFMDIIQSKHTNQLANMEQISNSYMKKLGTLRDNGEDITGTDIGFTNVNKVTNGFQPGDLIILAARPSVGKTAMGLNFILRAAKKIKQQGNDQIDKVVIFSLEMAKEQLYQRLLSMEAGVTSSKLRSGQLNELDWANVKQESLELAKLPILIDDTAGENIVDIQSKLKQLKNNQKYNIKLVVIDYLQLLHGPRIKGTQLNRQQEVSIISRMLKLLARELNVPIVALAQLSRAAEGSVIPQLSHLRESGSLEQDADLVCFLHKQDDSANKLNDETNYQTKNQDSSPSLSANNFKRITFIIAKHRNGITKEIPMFLDNCGVFQEL